MKRACIAVVDAAHARIYLYDEGANPGDELREVRDLANAGRRLKDSEVFSESRPGLAAAPGLRRSAAGGNRSDQGEPGSAYDDHRDAHIEEMDAKFAKTIVQEIDRYVREEKLVHLILIAAPKMLGTLRKHNGALHREDLKTDEITQNLTWVQPAQLHDQLAALNIVPPRQRLKMAR